MIRVHTNAMSCTPIIIPIASRSASTFEAAARDGDAGVETSTGARVGVASGVDVKGAVRDDAAAVRDDAAAVRDGVVAVRDGVAVGERAGRGVDVAAGMCVGVSVAG